MKSRRPISELYIEANLSPTGISLGKLLILKVMIQIEFYMLILKN